MPDIDSSKPILVTGASGYIASWIVKELLDTGHTVHGTVRSLQDPMKTAHLRELAADARGRLELFEADLLEEGSFQPAMEGCELVIHTASPFRRKVGDPQIELVDPAVRGTRNVLNTVNATPSVKKVALTSSAVAIYGDADELRAMEKNTFTEADWNLTSDLRHKPYSYSKTAAEKAAWRIQESQDRWEMAVLNPAFVLGPSLSARTDGVSTDFMLSFLRGQFKSGVPDLYLGMVDVRDVARAHIRAGFIPEARGRFILCRETRGMIDLAAMLKDLYGVRYPLPKRTIPKWLAYLIGPANGLSRRTVKHDIGYYFELDNSRSIDLLGIEYRPLRETLKDQVDQLEQMRLV